MKTRLFHLHALSALHVGTGQGVGAVDLPIARSRATNLPIVAGSAIKGVLRDELTTQLDKDKVKVLFGAEPNDNNNNPHAGAVAFGDANLLLLPIRSFAGTVAYATCPFILKRYQRDLLPEKVADIPTNPTDKQKTAFVVSGSVLVLGDEKIALEDLDLPAKKDDNAQKWAEAIAKEVFPNDENWQKELITRFVILPDDVFSFLADTATEIRTRIQIDRETRIVKQGALWSEENLPCETVLWGVFGVHESREPKSDNQRTKTADELNSWLPENELTLQMGGKHTVGRGLCRLLIAKAK